MRPTRGGHTIGHAIEAPLTYLLHSKCVAIGMVLEAKIARGCGSEMGLGQVGVGRLRRCTNSYGLPISLTNPFVLRSKAEARAASTTPITINSLLDHMAVNKKNTTFKLKKVVPPY